MPNDSLVTPLAFTLPHMAANKATDKAQSQPQFMPCTITAVTKELVTVKFEVTSGFTLPQVTIPQAFSEWVRLPTQVGDKGYAVPSGYYLGGQSGQGGGTANLYPRGNLTPLVFVPISQMAFPNNDSRNLNAVFINGKEGVVLQDTEGLCSLTLSKTGVTITIGGVTVTIDIDGLSVDGGDITNDDLSVGATHVHGGVTTGGDNTGVPNP